MMPRKIFVIMALVATVAFSQQDDIFVPEIMTEQSFVQAPVQVLVEAESAEASYIAAKRKMAALLQSGKSEDECTKSAEETIKGVFTEVTSSQTMINKLDDGSKCILKGKPHVDYAKSRLKAALDALSSATKGNTDVLSHAVKNAKKELKRTKEIANETRRECRCAVKKTADEMWKFATSMTVMRERTIVREMMLICIIKARKKTTTTTKTVTVSKVAPVDPCKKWKAEHKANKEISKALKAEVKFAGGATTLKPQGKTTLNAAAKILNKYPWMSITVEGHSDAPKGARCTALTIGRAKTTETYLKSQGVKNKMTRPVGKCGKKRAIEIIGNAAGRKAAPKGCKVEFDEDEEDDFSGAQLLQQTKLGAAAQCKDPSFKANLLKSRSVKRKLTITKTKLVTSVVQAVCGSKENKAKEAIQQGAQHQGEEVQRGERQG